MAANGHINKRTNSRAGMHISTRAGMRISTRAGRRIKWKTEYTAFLFFAGIASNIAVALLNGLLGFWNQSYWQIALCGYYVILMILKLILLFESVRANDIVRSRDNDRGGSVAGGKTSDRGGSLASGRQRRLSRLQKAYLHTSISLLTINIVLGGIVFLMATDQSSKHYPGHLIYGVAFYAFCKLIAGIVNLIKAGRRRAPVMLAMKSIGFVDALVSILMLEIALIDTFGDPHSGTSRTMMGLTGVGVWVLAAIVGVIGIFWYRRHHVM